MATTAPILIRNATILTMDPQVPDLEGGDILIVDGKIKAVGSDLASSSATLGSDIVEIDGTNRIVIPGFVDCHRHAWEGVLRFIAPNSKTLGEYFEVANFGFLRHFRPEDVYNGVYATAIGAIDAGITTLVDNMHCNKTPEHGKAALKAWIDSGLEASVALEFGSWRDEPLSEVQIEEQLKDARSAIPPDARSRVDIGMWGHYTEQELKVSKKTGARFFAEMVADHQSVLDKPAELGLLGSHITLNHCTGLTDENWKRMQEAGVRVNICPSSDAQWSLGGGFAPYQKAVSRGMRPGLSLDNEIAYGADMFTEMRLLSALQRALVSHGYEEGAPISVRELLRAATIDGAHAIGREAEIGSLTPGKWANVAVLNLDTPAQYPAHTAAGAVALAANRSNVDTVIVQGKVLKRDGKLVDFDFSAYKQQIDATVKHLKEAGEYNGSKITETFTLSK